MEAEEKKLTHYHYPSELLITDVYFVDCTKKNKDAHINTRPMLEF